MWVHFWMDVIVAKRKPSLNDSCHKHFSIHHLNRTLGTNSVLAPPVVHVYLPPSTQWRSDRQFSVRMRNTFLATTAREDFLDTVRRTQFILHSGDEAYVRLISKGMFAKYIQPIPWQFGVCAR